MSKISNTSYLNYIKKIGISSFLQENPNNFYLNNLVVKSVGEINNLDDLLLFVDKYMQNELKKSSSKNIIGTGNKNAKIMLIGKCPSNNENKIGKLFVNEVGELLDKMLLAIKLKKENIYISNIFPWMINNKEPTNDHILKILPFIQRQIEIIQPKIIILLGGLASKAILNSNLDFEKLRGKWHNYKSINKNKSISCIVTYNPKFLIKLPDFKKKSWQDLKLIQKKILDENL